MSWTAIEDRFIRELTVAHYSPTTVRMHATWLKKLRAYCQSRGIVELTAVTAALLGEYERHLLWEPPNPLRPGRFYAHSTVQHGLSFIRAFFGWATEKGLLLINPARHLVLRLIPQSERRLPSVAEIEAVLAVPDTTTIMGMRDAALLETFYGTGARRSELAALDVEDVGFTSMTIQIRHGKNGTGRLLPLGERMAEKLRLYLSHSRPYLQTKNGEVALFLGSRGERLSSPYMGCIVGRCSKAAGLSYTMTAHEFRHAFASHMLINGADMETLAALLGHASLDTSRFYTRFYPQHLVEEHRRYHPRAHRTNKRRRRADDDGFPFVEGTGFS